MPVCFQLIDRTSGIPATLQHVDAQLCQNLDLPFHNELYTCWWYDIIGFKLALGKSFAEITNDLRDNQAKYPKNWQDYQDLLRINAFLLEYYESSAWWEPR